MTVLHSEAPEVAQSNFGVFHRVADDKPVNALVPVAPASCAAEASARLAGRPGWRSIAALHATFANRLGGVTGARSLYGFRSLQ